MIRVAVLPATATNSWSPNAVWLEAHRLADERPALYDNDASRGQ